MVALGLMVLAFFAEWVTLANQWGNRASSLPKLKQNSSLIGGENFNSNSLISEERVFRECARDQNHIMNCRDGGHDILGVPMVVVAICWTMS